MTFMGAQVLTGPAVWAWGGRPRWRSSARLAGPGVSGDLLAADELLGAKGSTTIGMVFWPT
jgi:uncharacterized protein GlcG (DUF336 family)